MATTEKSFVTSPEVLAAYKSMFKAVPGVEWKGKTHPYLSLNGNIYSSVSKDEIIGIRLSKSDLADYLEKYQTGLFEPFPGFFQKEYVPIPKEMHSDIETMQHWFAKSFAYASSLKPKKTTRKKPE